MEDFQTFEPLTFLFYGVRLGNTSVIISNHEEVPLSSKAYECYGAPKIDVDILIELCCLLLRCLIILLYGFCLFIAMVYIAFSIINIGNVMVGEMSFYRGEV